MARGDAKDLFFRKLRIAGLSKPAVETLATRLDALEAADSAASSAPEFMYVYSNASQNMGAGDVLVTALTQFDYDTPSHPHVVWHADTNEVEFTADGEAWAQAEAAFDLQAAGGARLKIVGHTYERVGGDDVGLDLYLTDAVPLSIPVTSSNDVFLSGGAIPVAVEAGERWRLVAAIGGASAVMNYVDMGVYWRAGY